MATTWRDYFTDHSWVECPNQNINLPDCHLYKTMASTIPCILNPKYIHWLGNGRTEIAIWLGLKYGQTRVLTSFSILFSIIKYGLIKNIEYYSGLFQVGLQQPRSTCRTATGKQQVYNNIVDLLYLCTYFHIMEIRAKISQRFDVAKDLPLHEKQYNKEN